jgi:hypothetical protein
MERFTCNWRSCLAPAAVKGARRARRSGPLTGRTQDRASVTSETLRAMFKVFGLQSSPSFFLVGLVVYWAEPASCPPSIRARNSTGTPDATCAPKRLATNLGGNPIYKSGIGTPRGRRAPPPTRKCRRRSSPLLSDKNLLTPGGYCAADVLSRAPSGTVPVSRYRHRSMTNFRASATMPTRRIRLPALANRC